jgi:hypothetical protein
MTARVLLPVALIALSACSSESIAPAQLSPPSPSISEAVQPPLELGNLNYSTGTITVYHIVNGAASVYSRFRPENGASQGLAIDANGLIYTSITNGKQCGTCVEVFTARGRLTNTLVAPALTGAPGPAALNNVSVDATGNVYVSDSGQEAVYYYPPGSTPATVPSVVVRNASHLGAVSASPDGQSVVIGGCSFGSARVYRRHSSTAFTAGPCFSTPSYSLLGTASDNLAETLTPIDPATHNVAVSSPGGQSVFSTPNRTSAGVMSVAMNASGSLTYAADERHKEVYVFTRPGKRWLNGGQPRVLATYAGFDNLDIIAVPQ